MNIRIQGPCFFWGFHTFHLEPTKANFVKWIQVWQITCPQSETLIHNGILWGVAWNGLFLFFFPKFGVKQNHPTRNRQNTTTVFRQLMGRVWTWPGHCFTASRLQLQ